MKSCEFPALLRSDRIFLKKHEKENVEKMFQVIDSDRERLGKFLPWVESTKASIDTLAFIEESIEDWDENLEFHFAVFFKETNQFIGNICVHNISYEHKKCEIGYWLSSAHEGQEFMSEAVSALEKEAFALDFNRIEIRCSSSNKRSAGVPRRLGYSLEGVFKQDLIEQGQYRDSLIYAKLKDARELNVSLEPKIKKREVLLKDGSSIVLRSPIESDAEAYLEFAKEIFETSQYIITQPDEFKKDVKKHRENFLDSLDGNGTLKVVADVGGKIVGYLHFKSNFDRRHISHRGEFGISVIPDWQGKGLGEILIQELISWAKQSSNKVQKIELRVVEENKPALALYEKMGFKEEGKISGELKMSENEYLDTLMMGLWIK